MTQGGIVQGVKSVPQAAIGLAKRFEGFHRVPQSDPLRRAHPYVCPAGYWTIGWGHLCPSDHPPVTEAEAENYLAADLAVALAATLRYYPVLLNQPESRLAAIVDFTFNLGAGLGRTAAGRNCADGSADLTSTRCTNSYDAMNTSLCRNLNFPPCTTSSPRPFVATATSVA